MKKILVFGFGDLGKRLIDQCLDYKVNKEIVAIIDNNCKIAKYRDIVIIRPEEIAQYCYDEIWICTVYFKEIMKQLVDQYQISEDKMHFAEPVMAILDERIRKRYQEQIAAADKDISERKELFQYLREYPARMYCYPFYDEYIMRDTPIYFDADKCLYYGIYQGKRLYLARNMDTEQKARAYLNSILMEQDRRAPHCYANFNRLEKAYGIGIDVGAAEGIFALKIIDQVDHVYLAEVEKTWIEALRYTFEPYQEKVTVISKYISNKDDAESSKLDTLFPSQQIDFLKMDIEGMELEALEGAEKLLERSNASLAVCVYHHEADNDTIGDWLKDRGYHVRNSEGFVLCQGDWELENENPDFRKALIFAEK